VTSTSLPSEATEPPPAELDTNQGLQEQEQAQQLRASACKHTRTAASQVAAKRLTEAQGWQSPLQAKLQQPLQTKLQQSPTHTSPAQLGHKITGGAKQPTQRGHSKTVYTRTDNYVYAASKQN
jgi:hypothetical protein